MGEREECIEERQQQSAYSPGTVRDDESVARFVLRSEHFAPDGELAPAAFPVQDFLEPRRGGLSLARLGHMSREEVCQRAEASADGTNDRPTQGMAVAKTWAIRAIRSKSGARLFCVVDDGQRDFHAHAVAHLADRRSGSRSSARRARMLLMQAFALHRQARPGDRAR